jgi:hypothetical protein
MITRLPGDIIDHGLINGPQYTHNMYYVWRLGFEGLFRNTWLAPGGNGVVTTKDMGDGTKLVIEKHTNGEEYHEFINQDGELHRETGPAWLMFDKGKLIFEEYYLYGVEYSKEKYVMQGGEL